MSPLESIGDLHPSDLKQILVKINLFKYSLAQEHSRRFLFILWEYYQVQVHIVKFTMWTQ